MTSMSTEMTTPIQTVAEGIIPIIGEFIVKTPGTCSGQARVAGTRIKVKHICTWVEKMGQSPAQVVAEHPQLSMAAVHAALAYYWSHQEEIQRDIEAEDRLVAELKAKAGPSRLQENLAAPHGKDDPLPPG
jgi:uncharacterized protein (DUF433 family)